MTLSRRPSRPRCARPRPVVKPCLEGLESRIVPDAAAAVNYVLIFQSSALVQTNQQFVAEGMQLGKTLTGNAQGDQRVQADLATLDYTAAVTPLIQEAGALAGNPLQTPGGFSAGLGGLYLSADAAAFNVGLAVFAYTDLQNLGQAATPHVFNDLVQDTPIFQFYFSAASIPLGIMPSSLAFTGGQQTLLLGQAPTPAVTVSASAPTLTGNGNSYVFTAAISNESGIPPGGTVQFLEDGVAFGGPAPVSNGSAVSSPITVPQGTHTITALYSGDGFYLPSQGQTTVSPPANAGVQVAFTGAYPPYTLGASAQYTVTVQSGATGVNEGVVQFFADGVGFGGPVAVSGGSATSSSVALDAKHSPHTITAHYSDAPADFAAADAGNPVSQAVNKTTPTVSVTTASGPTVTPQGNSYTFSASVNPVAGFQATGTVDFFKDGDAVAFSTMTLTNGRATSGSITLSQGNHTITAKYEGDGNYLSSQSPATPVSVTAINVQLSFTNTSPPTYGLGGSNQYTVSVMSGAAAINEGTVQFFDNGSPLGGAVAVSGGSATSPAVPLDAANSPHTITAHYHDVSGNFGDADASNHATQTVTPATPTVSISSPQLPLGVPEPANQPITFTATVTGVGGFPPMGSVTFQAFTSQNVLITSVTQPVSNANTGITFTELNFSTGDVTVKAVYSGDGNYNAGNTAQMTIRFTDTDAAFENNPPDEAGETFTRVS